MKPRNNKGRLPLFVPLFKDTMNALAWNALSHGARSLFTALKCRYNRTLCGGVYLSGRIASKELGSHRDYIARWFRELEYYGFVVMVAPGCLVVDGIGKAPHWRLTDEWYHDEPPTRDFHRWDGTKFHEQKSPKSYLRKKQNPGPQTRATLARKNGPLPAHKSGPPHGTSGPQKRAIGSAEPGPQTGAISSSTIPVVVERSAEHSSTGNGTKPPWSTPVIEEIPSLDPRLVIEDDLTIPEFMKRTRLPVT